MAILMLEGKNRFINTDYIVTAYVQGNETDGFTITVVTTLREHDHLPGRFKKYEQAQKVLQDLAVAIEDARPIEMERDGIYT
jgi:hypothetical protein